MAQGRPYAVEGDPEEWPRPKPPGSMPEYDQDRIKALIANDGWA
jgi:hypothetical protein